MMQCMRAVTLGAVLCALLPACVSVSPGRARPAEAAVLAARLGDLENPAIYESSGLAASTRGQAVLWTHNDSGDRPRFFALGFDGRDLGEFQVGGAGAADWEDMCSFALDGKSYLLLADIGDNQKQRPSCTLYMVEEPDVAGPGTTAVVACVQAIWFAHEDGPHDCEAVAVDTRERLIYLVSKDWGWNCKAYTLPLDPSANVGTTLTAVAVADVGLVHVTAMDISPDGRKLVMLTYGHAYEYVREQEETWAEALKRDPLVWPVPKREQGESICYSPDGRRLYLTSEKLPAPLWEVTPPRE